MAKSYRLLQAIMNTPVEDELIRRDLCRIKGAGVERSAERPVATVEQVYAIADVIEPRYRALVLLARFGSLRWGELTALRRSDLDLDALTVNVDKAIVEDDGKFTLGPPKSDAGKRVVSIPQGRPLGGATSSATGTRRSTRRRCRGCTCTTRHTGNTLSAQTGATLRELMAHAGHSSSRAAIGYLHKVKERDRVIAQGLDELVRKSRREAAKKKREQRRKRDTG